MSDEQKQVEEKVDHVFHARQWLDAADREASTDANATVSAVELAKGFAAVAQVHASLAQVEQLERLNETLGGLVVENHIPNGTVDRKLKVTTDG